jgi:hypothetical protein
MKKPDFLTAVRKGGAKFRADNIVIATGAGDLRGKGFVEVAEGRFRIHVTVDNATPPPESPMGIMTRKDLWGISGVIEDEIHFSTRDLPHNGITPLGNPGDHRLSSLQIASSSHQRAWTV